MVKKNHNLGAEEEKNHQSLLLLFWFPSVSFRLCVGLAGGITNPIINLANTGEGGGAGGISFQTLEYKSEQVDAEALVNFFFFMLHITWLR